MRDREEGDCPEIAFALTLEHEPDPWPREVWLREYHPNGQAAPIYVRVKKPRPGDRLYRLID